MTLCVAAECKYKNGPCIVCCSDLSANRGEVSSEDMDKMRWVGNCHVMLAGSVTDAEMLLSYSAKAIESYEPADDPAVTSLIAGLADAIKFHKRYKATQYLSNAVGLSWDEWFNHGKRNFTEGHYIQICNEVASLQLGAELIISTFTKDRAVLLRIAGHGQVCWDDHYSAIGSGYSICEAFLVQRDHTAIGVAECLYRVLEAKVAAERNPHVGESSTFEILTPSARYDIDEGYIHDIGNRIERKRLIGKLKFSDAMLTEVKEENGSSDQDDEVRD